MEVFALYFSPTGNTKEVVRALAKGISEIVSGNDFYSIDLTTKWDRASVYEFGPKDIVIIGMPTYAGRIPNKIEPYVSSSIYGKGALAIPVVTYGNRSFDDSLKELATILTANEMLLCGGISVPCEHAFSSNLATGRPTEDDLSAIFAYGSKLGKSILEGKNKAIRLNDIPGRDMNDSQYYRPLKEDGEPASFLKAMPVTDESKCTGCSECRYVCPMGCFDDSVITPAGTCIKCHGCVKACPNGAKYFDDEDLKSHIRMLETNFGSDIKDIYFV